ncbi:MAG TPA: ribbon-helix-helix domain-containing protein [Candidatus Acidoferrales bacterium]|nr:ribbon-helix-helix domain-containing protein [Candidatus Acidoferrales bacterium]
MAPMKRILVQLTDEQLSALRANLEKKGAPIARQIREAVEQYLKKKK